MELLRTIDREILFFVTALGDLGDPRDDIVYFVADLLPFAATLAVAWIWMTGHTKRQKEKNQDLVLIVLASFLLAIAVRWLIGEAWPRQRPFLAYQELHHVDLLIADRPTASWPSLHALLLFTFAGVVYFSKQHRHIGVALLLLAAVVAAARVVAAVHYPSDVVGGALLGLGLAYLVDRQMRWMWRQLQ